MSLNIRKKIGTLVALGLVGSLALTGCASKAADTSSEAEGGVKTGAGIENGEISIGVLADLTGPFAALSKEVNQAMQMYWDEVNESGGVCSTYPVNLAIQDTGYNVQNAVSLFNQSSSKVLTYGQVVGASMTLAIIDQASEEDIVVMPRGGVAALVEREAALVTGATYNVESANLLQYMIESGQLSEGDKIGVIYAEGDYGQTALHGLEAAAERNGITILKKQVKATDTDMSSQTSGFLSEGVTAIGLAATPTVTASVASVLESNGQSLPIFGLHPTFAQSLLETDIGAYLEANMTVSYPSTSFDTEDGERIRGLFVETYPDEADPTLQTTIGYGDAAAMHQLLEAACESGDLTRAGVMDARRSLGTVETGGAYPVLDYSTPGVSATSEAFILSVANVPGGLELIEGPFQGEGVTPEV